MLFSLDHLKEFFFGNLIPNGDFRQDIIQGTFGNRIMIGDGYFVGASLSFFFKSDMAAALAGNHVSAYPNFDRKEISLFPETTGSLPDMYFS